VLNELLGPAVLLQYVSILQRTSEYTSFIKKPVIVVNIKDAFCAKHICPNLKEHPVDANKIKKERV
jgi:hypothetical protein